MKKFIKKTVKRSMLLTKLYKRICRCNYTNGGMSISIPEIGKFNYLEDKNGNKRLNLLIPSLNKDHIFGGISTAIKFYEELLKLLKVDGRIIITDASLENYDNNKFSKYKIVKSNKISDEKFQILPYNDRYENFVPIRKNDIFIATAWWTAYNLKDLIKWQFEKYNKKNKMLYFIQDFEPGFYAWGTRYMLAESTYKNNEDTIGIFNTKLLKDYFNNLGMSFREEYYFEPKLNEEMRQHLLKCKTIKKKKKIFIYGRPGVTRNCFDLIIEALKLWLVRYPKANEWELVSAGEVFNDIPLGGNIFLKSSGKLTLEEYSKLLEESYMGLSFMVSPHPSYPPLELDVYGGKIITNSYSNKNLSLFSENITSLDPLTVDAVVEEMIRLCENYKDNQTYTLDIDESNFYINNSKQFDFLDQLDVFEKEKI